jgi:hypothetical protein
MNNLWTDSTRIRSVQLIHHARDGIRSQCHIVMKETEEPTVSLHKLKNCVARGAISRVRTEESHDRLWQFCLDDVEDLSGPCVLAGACHQCQNLQ